MRDWLIKLRTESRSKTASKIGISQSMYTKIEHDPTGHYVTIRCKPFLKKPHLVVGSGKASLVKAIESAVTMWEEAIANTEDKPSEILARKCRTVAAQAGRIRT